ncbi:MAG: ParB N-terminal domain-containing protein [Nitrospirae bacterium]|nr:ParB N-terminal domain-containing protein [Nitrospirota bacterium]
MSEGIVPTGKEFRRIAIDKLVPNDWNVNKMSDEEFNRLTAEIQEVGFITPLEVVPLEGGEEKYEIVGGHHRWQACKILGYTELDCTVLTDKKWEDKDLRKFVSVRLNVIHGKIDSEKFIKLYEEMEKKYGADSLKNLMGFTDDAAWNKLTAGVREALESTGLPKGAIDKFEESIKEIKTVDGLSTVLNKIFTEHGDTLRYNFISFSFGSKSGIFIMCEENAVYTSVEELVKTAKDKSVRADTAVGKFLKNWKDAGIDDLKPNVVEDPEPTGAEY